jgi:hypothetical protein
VLEEGVVKPIAPPGTLIYGLSAPTNEGEEDVYIYTPGAGGSAPSLTTLFALGQRYPPSAQIQLQDFIGVDLSAFYGSIVPDSAPAPNAVVPSGSYMCDTGASGFPTVAEFTAAQFSQPGVGANVTVTLHDATPFAGLSPGDGVYVGGGTYSFVSTTGGLGGTITITNRGLGGARVTMTA